MRGKGGYGRSSWHGGDPFEERVGPRQAFREVGRLTRCPERITSHEDTGGGACRPLHPVRHDRIEHEQLFLNRHRCRNSWSRGSSRTEGNHPEPGHADKDSTAVTYCHFTHALLLITVQLPEASFTYLFRLLKYGSEYILNIVPGTVSGGVGCAFPPRCPPS